MADKAAKEAVEAMEVNNSIIQAEDEKKYLKQRMIDLWQSELNDTDTGLKHIKQRVQLQPSPIDLKQRRDQVVITRLRIGHAHLTSSYLLLGRNPTMCDICEEQLNINHLITQCIEYEPSRQQMGIADNLKECLSEYQNQTKIIRFSEENQLYMKI
ncbi:hypothetical protein JTB14_017762 [Gonioctena quinquepunctata]|nr:hypothetical protein JTB14_017762 [Gonioctena quinquepunctata]